MVDFSHQFIITQIKITSTLLCFIVQSTTTTVYLVNFKEIYKYTFDSLITVNQNYSYTFGGHLYHRDLFFSFEK